MDEKKLTEDRVTEGIDNIPYQGQDVNIEITPSERLDFESDITEGATSVKFYLDIETTGLNSEINQILEIGALAVLDNGRTFRYHSVWPMNINNDYLSYSGNRYHNAPIDPTALIVNGRALEISEDDVNPARRLMFEFINWMLSIIRSGGEPLKYKTYFYNSLFDLPFLIKAGAEVGLNLKNFLSGYHAVQDILSCVLLLQEINLIPSNITSLAKVYEYYKGYKHIVHNALQDAIATYEVHDFIKQNLQVSILHKN